MTFNPISKITEIPTLGVEVEYQIVDPETRELSSNTEVILQEGAEIYGSNIRPEFHAAMVECLTTPCATVRDVVEQVAELRRTLIGLARKRGLRVVAASTHPTTHWREVKLTTSERYLQIQRDLGDVARSNLIYGMHCHVGIEDKEARIAVMNSVRYFLPHLLAMTCSSPFWQGRDTGLASTRTGIFRRFPRTGIPDYFGGWAEFEAYVKALVDTECIDNAKKIYWDIRPHPFFPTVEFRNCDVPTRMQEVGAVVGFIHALSTRLVNLWHRNMGYRLHRRAFINENIYRAVRHGINAEFIDLHTKKVVPMRDAMRALIDELKDEIDLLGLDEEMGALEEILSKGTSADRQRAVFRETGDLNALVDHLIAETEEGMT
ncbi:MAG: carboxylate-amine ligase [Planctomycetota bacterium]|nr:carboxylate-amine ligase [Planctomycetota bacterium]